MRAVVIILTSFLVLFLAACNSSEQNKVQEEASPDLVEEQPNDKTGEEKQESNSEESPTETEEPIEDDSEEELGVDEEVTAQYRVSENWSLVPIEEGTNENVVLLTIDDAPDQYALEMAKILTELDADAIFFVNGHFIDTPEEKEVLKQIHEMGFEIGNHTYSHVNLKSIENNPEKQREEIVQLNDVIEEIIGERPKFFRAPHGVNTDTSKKIVEEENMVLMNWSYGYDYFTPYMDKEKLVTAMVTGEGPEVDVPYSLLKPGANLLMHDREWTKEALKEIVIGLREQGYEILDPRLIETSK
ncbi:polysaccharide deacetylase family protein [Ornithinibacillus californiensis]|uniref:polysaccharide deacetylase family protein n=1 Tax=Ornithinibacillus californiensis TaxID=161536 RepID=UPI00064DFD45|nr:polysaccharide deacetylase family protein [Ornithinibacillus californiensis]